MSQKLIIVFLYSSFVYNERIAVKRKEDGDEISPVNLSCSKYINSTCNQWSDNACRSCSCDNGTTFINDHGTLVCMSQITRQYECQYQFVGGKNMTYPSKLKHFEITSGETLVLGAISTLQGNDQLMRCRINEHESTYWNKFNWTPLFTADGQNISNFLFKRNSKKQLVLMFDGKPNEKQITNASSYSGLIIKLVIKCEDEGESCLIFKTKGVAFHNFIFNDDDVDQNDDEKKNYVIVILHSVMFILIILNGFVHYSAWNKSRKKSPKQSFIRNSTQQSRKQLIKKINEGSKTVFCTPSSSAGRTSNEYKDPIYLQAIEEEDQSACMRNGKQSCSKHFQVERNDNHNVEKNTCQSLSDMIKEQHKVVVGAQNPKADIFHGCCRDEKRNTVAGHPGDNLMEPNMHIPFHTYTDIKEIQDRNSLYLRSSAHGSTGAVSKSKAKLNRLSHQYLDIDDLNSFRPRFRKNNKNNSNISHCSESASDEYMDSNIDGHYVNHNKSFSRLNKPIKHSLYVNLPKDLTNSQIMKERLKRNSERRFEMRDQTKIGHIERSPESNQASNINTSLSYIDRPSAFRQTYLSHEDNRNTLQTYEGGDNSRVNTSPKVQAPMLCFIDPQDENNLASLLCYIDPEKKEEISSALNFIFSKQKKSEDIEPTYENIGQLREKYIEGVMYDK